MQYCPLGKTGSSVSRIAFGAGPTSQLMVHGPYDRQREVVCHALEQGINWFDTAPTYGDGASESRLGGLFEYVSGLYETHVATKVRLMPDNLQDIRATVFRSVEGSVRRFHLKKISLLQLHNSITACRGDEPT